MRVLGNPLEVKSFTYQATSEYGSLNPLASATKSSLYTINITREAQNSDTTLKELEVLILGVDEIINFEPSVKTYVIENIGDSVTSIQIKASPNAPTSTVNGTGVRALNSVNGYNFLFSVLVTAEDGTTAVYEIEISRGPINADDDNTIIGLNVFDSANVYYINNLNFDPLVKEYNITIPFGPVSYTINPSVVTGSPANLSGDIGQFVINASNRGSTIKHTVFAVSKSGNIGEKYEINVTLVAPSSEKGLNFLRADGSLIPGFSINGGVYTLNRLYEEVSITLTAQSIDSNATISGLGSFSLNEGLNTFIVSVTAQDGSIAQHVINVNRAYANPYLIALGVNGEQLLDSNKKAVIFDKDLFEYNVVVPYYKSFAEIFGTSPNSLDTIFGLGNKDLMVGDNTFKVTVLSVNATQVEYSIIITRLTELSANTNVATAKVNTITNMGVINELVEFTNEFSNTKYEYGPYIVPNKVTSLQLLFTPENNTGSATDDPATANYYNFSNLKIGMNEVGIVIVAADGVTTKTFVLFIVREEMSYEVNVNAYPSIDVTQDLINNLTYHLDLGGSSASDYDFSKFISVKNESIISIEVLSSLINKPTEVFVKVSDGSEFDIIKFVLKYDEEMIEDLEFEIDENFDENIKVSVVDLKTNLYKLEIGKKSISDIDFEKLILVITSNGESKIEVLTNLSNNPSEVVIKVSDDTSFELVIFEIVASVGFLSGVFGQSGWLYLILFIICLVILIGILIAVRIDKYGRIVKNRKMLA